MVAPHPVPALSDPARSDGHADGEPEGAAASRPQVGQQDASDVRDVQLAGRPTEGGEVDDDLPRRLHLLGRAVKLVDRLPRGIRGSRPAGGDRAERARDAGDEPAPHLDQVQLAPEAALLGLRGREAQVLDLLLRVLPLRGAGRTSPEGMQLERVHVLSMNCFACFRFFVT